MKVRFVSFVAALIVLLYSPAEARSPERVTAEQIRSAFQAQSFTLTSDQAERIRHDVEAALVTSCANRYRGNSKVGFQAVQIAQLLEVNTKIDPTVENRISKAIESLPCGGGGVVPRPAEDLGWERYFDETISLNQNQEFQRLVNEKGFSPVHISWEDIGRYNNSVWGDRISDVGIWVRKHENDPQSASLALSVRRDQNYRDKVLMVPVENIKIHRTSGGATRELNLRERLQELGLTSERYDRNVIVSNQFAVVPVPKASGHRSEELQEGEVVRAMPARAAFNFSIYPYGSTNFVITDVIEGSSDAIVGPGSHQLLYYNADGEKAPFTASRAEERQDLLKLEADLKAKGMDVDVQRYYLIQIPLKRDAAGISLSNMGTPPFPRYKYYDMEAPMMLGAPGASAESMAKGDSVSRGMGKVAIGHGAAEGRYFAGSGYQGQRAEEPIRVTVVYFVTPIGQVTRADMDSFAEAFAQWDSKAIWGGSFVTKEE